MPYADPIKAKQYWKEYVQRPEIKKRRRERSNERYRTNPVFRKTRINGGYSTYYKNYDKEQWPEICRMRDEEDCFYCGNDGVSIDHLVPKSKGGTHDISNLVPCCKSCNSSKGNKSLEEWY